MDLAEWKALGLYDPDPPDAAERRSLLELLDQQGVTPLELAAAEREGRLASILMDRSVGGGGELLTIGDVAERAGSAHELLNRIWRAAGFPDPDPEARLFTQEDVEVLASFGLAAGYFGEEVALQMVRVIGSSMARIADATLRAALANVDDALFVTASSPVEAVRTSAELLGMLPLAARAMDVLLPPAPPACQPALRGPLARKVRRRRDARSHRRLRRPGGIHRALARLVTAHPGPGGLRVRGRRRRSRHVGRWSRRQGAGRRHDVRRRRRRECCEIALGLAAPGELLVTLEARVRVAGDRYRFEAIGRRSIRGLAEPVELFRVART